MSDEFQAGAGQDTNCSILLVEDSVINQKLVIMMLRKYGIEPEVAACGKAAVEAISDKEFDLILMDLNMPGMDGIQAARIIQEKLGERCPPIIAVTADAVFKIDDEMAQYGFKDLLLKPISRDSLIGCIRSHTTNR